MNTVYFDRISIHSTDTYSSSVPLAEMNMILTDRVVVNYGWLNHPYGPRFFYGVVQPSVGN